MLPLNEITYGVLRFGRKALAAATSNTPGVRGKAGAAGVAGGAGRFLKSVPRGKPVGDPAVCVRSIWPPKFVPTILDVRFKPSRSYAIDHPARITVCPASPLRRFKNPDLKLGCQAKPIVGARLCLVP